MAKVSTVQKSRTPRTCGRTGHVIPPGSLVYSASPGYRGRTIYRCAEHPFRPSELTTSMAAQPLAALEQLQDTLNVLEAETHDALDQLTSSWEEFTSEVRDYAEQRRTAAEAWEYGNSQLEELADTAETAADEAEQHEVEEWDGDFELLTTSDPEEPDADAFGDEVDYLDAVGAYEERLADIQEARDAWAEHVRGQIEAALDVANGLEF